MAPVFTGLSGGDEKDDHSDVRSRASDYIDGELDGSDGAKVESHLAKCPPCAAFVNTLRATINLLRSSGQPGAPNSFKDRLRQSIRRLSG